jgi:hypothetical protein
MKTNSVSKQPLDAPYHFFQGELTDAPGRNETWDHYLRYKGNGRWELITHATDFSGMLDLPPTKELMSTRQMVHWALERDDEIRESDQAGGELNDGSDENDLVRTPGVYAERLREIAVEVKADYCVKCLDDWLTGTWPNVPSIKILKIQGVTRRGIWIKIFHSVYEVETNLGLAYMYPPAENGFSKVILKSEGTMSAGRQVKVSNTILNQLEAFRSAWEKLSS